MAVVRIKATKMLVRMCDWPLWCMIFNTSGILKNFGDFKNVFATCVFTSYF